jgi:hypothetical protein
VDCVAKLTRSVPKIDLRARVKAWHCLLDPTVTSLATAPAHPLSSSLAVTMD